MNYKPDGKGNMVLVEPPKPINLPLRLVETVKRDDDIAGYWVFQADNGLEFLLFANGELYFIDDNDKPVMRVKLADYGLDPKSLE